MAKATLLLLALANWPTSLAYDAHVGVRVAASRRGFMKNIGVASLAAAPSAASAAAPSAASAAATSVQSDYDGFASGYDKLDGGSLASVLGLEELRAKLIGRARGRTLEVVIAQLRLVENLGANIICVKL